MSLDGIHHFRVLIANQRTDRLELLAEVVTGLGHEVIAREIHVSDVAAVTARERPDVALVGLGENTEHALQQISEIVAEAFCPVIALLDTYDGGWVNEAGPYQDYSHLTPGRRMLAKFDLNISNRNKLSFRYNQLDSDTDVLLSNSIVAGLRQPPHAARSA